MVEQTGAHAGKGWKGLINRTVDIVFHASAPNLAHLIASVSIKAVIAFVAGMAALSPFCVTQIRDYDLVVLREWGKRVNGEIPPGLKWYWPIINSIHRYDIRPRMIEIRERDQDGSEHLAGIGALSRDGWQVGVVTSISYTLDRDKWQAVDDNFGSDDSETTRKQIESRIKVDVRHAIQNLMPQYGLEYLLDHRSELIQNTYVTLGLSNSPNPGTQQTVDPKGDLMPFEVRIPHPLPIEPLSRVGIVLKSLAVQFETLADFDKLQRESAISRTKSRLAVERAEQFRREQQVAEEEAKVLKIEAMGKAEAELAILRAKQQVSPATTFFEKWNGKLPEVILGSDAGVQQVLGELIRSRVTGSVPSSTGNAR